MGVEGQHQHIDAIGDLILLWWGKDRHQGPNQALTFETAPPPGPKPHAFWMSNKAHPKAPVHREGQAAEAAR